jgi:hypothetical protein
MFRPLVRGQAVRCFAKLKVIFKTGRLAAMQPVCLPLFRRYRSVYNRVCVVVPD